MRRREFITLIGGAAAAWPLATRAEERVRRIGVLVGFPEDDSAVQGMIKVFQRGLQQLGWVEGRNLQISYRFAGPSQTRIEANAAELIDSAPDVILASPGQVALTLRKMTGKIAIVFAGVPDPVDIGLVQSLSHPGGNVTGFTSFESDLAGKWAEVLKEIAPHVTRFGVLYFPQNPAWPKRLQVIESVAPSLRVKVTPVPVSSEAEIAPSLATFAAEPDGGLVVLPSTFMASYRRNIIEAAARYRLPAVYSRPQYATDGGLLAYGFDWHDQFRRAASYVDRILKGEMPAKLPVQASTKFELIINLKTAKALGLTVPPTLLARADEVIE